MENTSKNLYSTQKVNILIVAPGSVYSTYDMYRYYMDAIDRNPATIGGAGGFAYHNIIEYHRLAREAFTAKHNVPYGSEMHDMIRASRELIIEIYANKPDVVLFIDGSKFPAFVFEELHKFIRFAHIDTVTACYLTEAPYIDDPIAQYDQFFDVIFTNDQYDYNKRAAKSQYQAVRYLPHSFSEDVHFPTDEQKIRDVFFCGTLFPERSKIFADVNWNGINAMITGTWMLASPGDYEKLQSIGVGYDHIMKNADVAREYQRSRIVINVGRTFGWKSNLDKISVNVDNIYSMGPRVVEAAACGAFIVSEYRPEIKDVFGDAIPFFSSAGELEELVRYYVSHENERVQKADKILSAVSGMSYDDRLSNIIIPAFTSPA